MENTQNVTLSIPKEILRQAKIIAIKKNTSLSGLLTQTLMEIVKSHETYDQARRHNLAILKHGYDLGTKGQIPWKRDEIHER